MKRKEYGALLKPLHVELLKMQKWVASTGQRILAIFEGRDAAGKGGAIKRLTKHLNPRGCRIVALGKPTERERGDWYFQRYVPHLPSAGEIAVFDRSWYNRAGLERVMGYCTEAQAGEFLKSVSEFESLLIRSGLTMFKFYFTITREEQARRIERRTRNPLKQWKLTPLDREAQARWDDYTRAEEEMFRVSATNEAPWVVVDADDKRLARIHVIRHLLCGLDYPDRDRRLLEGESAILRTRSS